MMSQEKVVRVLTFNFSTPIVAVSEEATYQPAELQVAERLIKGYVTNRKLPGIDEVCITLRFMEVRYISGETTKAVAATFAGQLMRWAAKQKDLFPQKGSITPTASMSFESRKAADTFRVEANFKTRLCAYTVDDEHDAAYKRFGKELVRLDGVVDYGTWATGVALRFDSIITPVDDAKRHMQELLQSHADDSHSEFFPFAKGRELEIDWLIAPVKN
jgi:hypothetical protein